MTAELLLLLLQSPVQFFVELLVVHLLISHFSLSALNNLLPRLVVLVLKLVFKLGSSRSVRELNQRLRNLLKLAGSLDLVAVDLG